MQIDKQTIKIEENYIDDLLTPEWRIKDVNTFLKVIRVKIIDK